MTERDMTDPTRQGFGTATLVATTLAASLALFANPGLYDWFSGIVGVTLCLVLLAYEWPRRRTRLVERLSLGAVGALAGLLVVGVLLEKLLELQGVNVTHVCRQLTLSNGVTGELCEDETRIPPWMSVSVWVGIALVVTVLDLALQHRRHAKD